MVGTITIHVANAIIYLISAFDTNALIKSPFIFIRISGVRTLKSAVTHFKTRKLFPPLQCIIYFIIKKTFEKRGENFNKNFFLFNSTISPSL